MIDESKIILYFDEPDHKYTDQFHNVYTSSTTLIHNYVTPFKSNYWSKKKADERGVSQKEIKDEWKFLTDHACTKGTVKHDSIEQGIKQGSKFASAVKFNNLNTKAMFTIHTLLQNKGFGKIDLNVFYEKIGTKYPDIYKAISFFANDGYSIYAEIGVFSFEHLISGMVDCFLIKGNEFIILDWKTNKNEIKFDGGYYLKDKPTGEFTDVWRDSAKFMNYPLDNLTDCNGIHYTLQLSLYARLIERCGLVCKGLFLAHIRDQYELNKWGMPKKDPITKLYIPIPNTIETVQWHNVKYLKGSIDKLLAYHYVSANINDSRITQTKLYD